MAGGRLALLVLLATAAPARAHPLAPSLLKLHERGDGRVDVTWKTPLMRPRGALQPAPALPTHCGGPGESPISSAEPDGVRTRWTVACGGGGLVGARVGVTGLDGFGGSGALVRVVLADGRVAQGLVSARAPWLIVPPRPRRLDVLRDYAALGVEHIVTGLDHLLFVFGLVLLAGTTRRIVGTVSAFTLGHSLTLSLAVLDAARVPAAPVEVAIAFSVLVLAIEIARDPSRPTLIRSHPWAMAGAFGLLHGLGFAVALRAAGLPSGEIPLALLAFNGGIEVGQLGFVLAALGLRRGLAGRMPDWARVVPVYAMGSLAAAWWLERTAALFR